MKKGFTLVELLAVIVILAIILVIAIPSISNVIENSQINAFIRNEQMLVKSVKNYIAIDDEVLPINLGDSIEVSLNQLQTGGYINPIKNPKGSNNCGGYVVITKISNNNDFSYIPYLNCVDNTRGTSVTDGLVGYWRLDGNALDYSIKSREGTITGAATTTNRFNVSNTAYNFDGIDDYISSAAISEIATTKNLTVSAWIKPTDLSSTYEISNQGQWDGGPWTGWRFQQVNNYLNLKLGDGSSTNYSCSSSTSTLTANSWHYVVGVWNGTNMILYDNAVEVGRCAKTLTYVGNGDPHNIGKYAGSSYYYKGAIDDVTVYSRALSVDEIKYNYDVEKVYSN